MTGRSGFGVYSLHIVGSHLPSEVIPHWCERMPLCSRCAILRKHNAPDQIVRAMMEAWEKWRVEP
jgi:hypothetical protein